MAFLTELEQKKKKKTLQLDGNTKALNDHANLRKKN